MIKALCWQASLILIWIVFGGNSAFGQTFLSCFSRETLDLVKDVMTYKSDYLNSALYKKEAAIQYNDIGFKDIAMAEKTAGRVRCNLTVIDKKASTPRTSLTYDVVRTNRMPYVRVYFDSGLDRGYSCNPLLSQALVIPSETSCLEP